MLSYIEIVLFSFDSYRRQPAPPPHHARVSCAVLFSSSQKNQQRIKYKARRKYLIQFTNFKSPNKNLLQLILQKIIKLLF